MGAAVETAVVGLTVGIKAVGAAILCRDVIHVADREAFKALADRSITRRGERPSSLVLIGANLLSTVAPFE